MKLSYGKFAATHLNSRATLTQTGEVAMVDSMLQAGLRFNQNFWFGEWAVFQKSRPVKILNAITRELLVVQFYDRLDTPIAAVWARELDTGKPYVYKRRPRPAPASIEANRVETLFKPSLPEPLADEWW